MKVTDVYTLFHPATAKYIFYLAAHGTFSKINHISGHKTSLKKYKNNEITPRKLSDHNVIKLELRQALVAHAYNPNYSGGRDQ
jgi:hypothetical protein